MCTRSMACTVCGAARVTNDQAKPSKRNSAQVPRRRGNEKAARRRSVMAQENRLNNNVPLVPPNPKLFFTATSMTIDLASLGQ